MSVRDTKRPRHDDVEEQHQGLETLKEAVAVLANSVTIVKGLKDFAALFTGGDTSIYRVLDAHYFPDVGNLGYMLCPMELQKFDIVRSSGKGRITSIHDGKSLLKDSKLSRLLAIGYLKSQGFDTIIFSKEEGVDARVSCLALPERWQIEEDPSARKKDHHDMVFRLYGERNFTRMFASAEQFKDVLSLEYIPLWKLKGILTKLNQLVERQVCNFELKSLVSIRSILDARVQDSKRSESDFLEELVSAAVSTSSLEDKVKIFITDPSPTLARRLALQKPYSGRLIEQSTNRNAELVELDTLDDEDEVLISSISLDTKFYNSVTGDVRKWKVFKASESLGIVREKKGWSKLEGQTSMKKKYLFLLLKAIAAENSASQSLDQLEDADEDSGEMDLADDIDF